MREDEKRMYGMSKDDIRTQYLESITAQMSGLEMVVASILSDCQEMMGYTNDASYKSTEEAVRKQMNVAKFILFEMMDNRRFEENEEMVLVNSDGEEIA